MALQIALQRLREDAQSSSEVQHALWDRATSRIHSMISGPARDQVLSDYLWRAESDGLADGSWFADDEMMLFSFSDAAGLCNMSSAAALHWLEMALWSEIGPCLLRDAGWESADLPDLPANRKMLFERSSTLVVLRDNLYVVARQGRGTALGDNDLSTDDGLPRISIEELTIDERVTVEAASYGGFCACGYCINVLEGLWLDGRIEDVRPTWTALDELTIEEAAALAAVKQFTESQWRNHVDGPPELQTLRRALAAKRLDPPLSCVVSMIDYRAR